MPDSQDSFAKLADFARQSFRHQGQPGLGSDEANACSDDQSRHRQV